MTPLEKLAKDLDKHALERAQMCARLLLRAYRRGARRGGSVDWQDVNDAWSEAKAYEHLTRKASRARKKVRK